MQRIIIIIQFQHGVFHVTEGGRMHLIPSHSHGFHNVVRLLSFLLPEAYLTDQLL